MLGELKISKAACRVGIRKFKNYITLFNNVQTFPNSSPNPFLKCVYFYFVHIPRLFRIRPLMESWSEGDIDAGGNIFKLLITA